MDVPTRDRTVGWIVDEELVAVDVEQARTVSRSEVFDQQDLVRRSGGHYPASQQNHIVSRPGLGQLVGGHDQCASLGGFVVDHLVDGLGGNQIESRQRFVQEQEVVVLGETLGHEHPLALAAG